MTTQILASEPDLILKDGTLVTINEEYDMMWFHPDGKLTDKSFRLNLKLKMVDVVVGADFKP